MTYHIKTFLLIPFLLIFLLLAGICQADTLQGRVVKVADGDTITILDSARTQHRIRLAQIDAPEKNQPYGQKAKQRMAALVFGKDVLVEVETTDRYGRLVGTVFVGGVDANREMVRSGLAWIYRRYARDPDLYRIEKEARDGKLGLWADPTPTPPWEWRRTH